MYCVSACVPDEMALCSWLPECSKVIGQKALSNTFSIVPISS